MSIFINDQRNDIHSSCACISFINNTNTKAHQYPGTNDGCECIHCNIFLRYNFIKFTSQSQKNRIYESTCYCLKEKGFSQYDCSCNKQCINQYINYNLFRNGPKRIERNRNSRSSPYQQFIRNYKKCHRYRNTCISQENHENINHNLIQFFLFHFHSPQYCKTQFL